MKQILIFVYIQLIILFHYNCVLPLRASSLMIQKNIYNTPLNTTIQVNLNIFPTTCKFVYWVKNPVIKKLNGQIIINELLVCEVLYSMYCLLAKLRPAVNSLGLLKSIFGRPKLSANKSAMTITKQVNSTNLSDQFISYFTKILFNLIAQLFIFNFYERFLQ